MIDLSEIKKLTIKEKLSLIDALWLSIDEEQPSSENKVNEDQLQYGIEEEEESPEIIAMLEQRWKDIEDGKIKTIPAHEAEKDISQFIADLKKISPHE